MAMLLYPGGTIRDPSTSGYSFFQNFLSDLGRTVAWGGQPNYRSAFLFVTSFVILALALAGSFVVFIRLFSSSRNARYSARTAGADGAAVLHTSSEDYKCVGQAVRFRKGIMAPIEGAA
jgi:hypothetical protein